MTTITVYGTAQGEVRGFEASGHAGSAQSRRNDLVCCAVSVLTQTCVNALEAVAGIVPDVTLRDGYLRVILMYQDVECKRERAEAMVKAATCFDKLGQAARAENLRAQAKSI